MNVRCGNRAGLSWPVTHGWQQHFLNCLLALVLAGVFPSGQATETITLNAEDNWFPFSAYRNGQTEGFVVDVIRAAYAAVAIEVKFDPMPFKRCLTKVESGTDLGCFTVNRQEDTEKQFLLHKVPLFNDTGGIYDMEKSGLPAKVSPADLIGHRVGYTHGYTYGDYLDNTDGIIKEEAPNDLSNLKKLAYGRQEYSLVSVITAAYLFKTYPKDFPVLPRLAGTVTEQEMFVGFSRHRPDSIEAAAKLDEGLLIIRKNGTYSKIVSNWLGRYPMLDDLLPGKTKSR